mgnify:CR=1 FL=1
MLRSRVARAIAAVSVVIGATAACVPTSGGDGEFSVSPSPASTDGATSGGPSLRPATDARSLLNLAYESTGAGFDALVMGFDVDEVEAQWYRSNGFYVVVYEGLDLEATGPLCPGASIQLPTGVFDHVSNAPTSGADCSTFTTLTSDPDVGVLVCDGVVSYRSAIPAGTEGDLFGSIERAFNGGYMGITAITPASAGIPEIDLDLLSC